MRSSCFLFFSLASLSLGFDFFSLSLNTGAVKVMDPMPFDVGYITSADFRAYTEFFYLGGKLGLSSNRFESPEARETLEQMPLMVTFGTSHDFYGEGEDADSKRYYLGLGVGFSQGTLKREITFSEPKLYSDLKLVYSFEIGLILKLFDFLRLGPFLEARTGDFKFNDPYLSNGSFMREYDGFSLVMGFTSTYLWGR